MMFKGLYTTLKEKKTAKSMYEEIENAKEITIKVGENEVTFREEDFVRYAGDSNFETYKILTKPILAEYIAQKQIKIDNMLGNMKV